MAGRGRWGGPVTEVPGRAARTPGSLLRGLVSTVLTLTSLALKRPAGIVGILRFVFGVQRRCRVDVSTMTPASRQASPTGPPSPPGRSAPVRGDVAPEAVVIGAGATRGGGVEALCGTAEGVMLVIRPRQVLRALTASHTFPVPRREGHHSTTAPRTPPLRRHASVCGRLRLRGPHAARSTGHDGVIHCAVHAITHGIA